MITVVNLSRGLRLQVEPVNRTTSLGNPFFMKREADRESVIKGYKYYLWLVTQYSMSPGEASAKVRNEFSLSFSSSWANPTREEFIGALDRLYSSYMSGKDLYLGCHCAPKACHADVIKSYLEWRKEQQSNETLPGDEND